MTSLVAAALVFAFMRRVLSGSPLREAFVARMGEPRFQGAFALATVLNLLWLGIAYAIAAPAFREPLWPVPALASAAQFVLQPLALFLMVAGFMTPNPGTVRQEGIIDQPDIVRGVLRITRHPFLWGVALFSAAHLAAVPSPRAFVLFGTLSILALAGTRSIDAKRRRTLGNPWTGFAKATSNLPFGAIIAGRQHLIWDELGGRPLVIAALLTLVSLVAHPGIRRPLLGF